MNKTDDSYLPNLQHTIATQQKHHTLLLELNQPKKRNAITDEMISEIELLLKKASEDSSIRVLVITGVGKAFCAGGDVKAMAEKKGMFAGSTEQLRRKYINGIQRIPMALESFEKPVIAAINGAAIGAGLDLACMADIRLASSSALFGETFTKLGLISGDGGGFFLQRVIGYAKALELSLTAEVFDASRALAMGLVSKVSQEDQLLDDALAYAQKIAGNAPLATRHCKALIKSAHRQEHREHLQQAALVQGVVQNTQEHLEGVQALLEKRAPKF